MEIWNCDSAVRFITCYMLVLGITHKKKPKMDRYRSLYKAYGDLTLGEEGVKVQKFWQSVLSLQDRRHFRLWLLSSPGNDRTIERSRRRRRHPSSVGRLRLSLPPSLPRLSLGRAIKVYCCERRSFAMDLEMDGGRRGRQAWAACICRRAAAEND